MIEEPKVSISWVNYKIFELIHNSPLASNGWRFDNESMNIRNKKGFTLLELLIVFGIMAVLVTAVILILNPAELFAQARDSQRISDLGTLKSAIALYLSTVSSYNLGDPSNCYVYATSKSVIGANCGGRHAGSNVEGTSFLTDGTGWVPIDFNAVPGGSPLTALPKDPRNDDTYFYSYAANTATGVFELSAKMESKRYSQGGPDDLETADGGNQPGIYEVGNDSGLDL